MKDFWKLVFSGMALNLVITLFSPLIAIFIQNIGEKNVIYVGYVFGAGFILESIVTLYFGKLADKHGRKRFLILGNLIYSIVPFGYIFATNINQVILLSMITGMALGILSPAYSALFTDKMKRKERGSGFGILNAGVTFIVGLGALLGASIVQFFGFKTLFIIMGVMQLTQTILLATVKE